jgi:hypothetical protein
MFSLLSASVVLSSLSYQQIDKNGNVNQINIGEKGNNNSYNSSGMNDESVAQFEKKLNKFNQLFVKIPADIIVKKGESKIIIRAQSHVHKSISAKVDDSVLNIDSKGFSTNKKLVIEIFTHSLIKVELANAAELTVENIDQKNLEINLSGASSAFLHGKINDCQFFVEGAAEIEAQNLVCNNIEIQAEGSADVVVFAKKSITGKASEAVEIEVFGSPKIQKLTQNDVAEIIYR